MSKIATARKNGAFGFKAVVKYLDERYAGDERLFTPIRKNFDTSEAATAYAQKWIDANDNRPVGVRKW